MLPEELEVLRNPSLEFTKTPSHENLEELKSSFSKSKCVDTFFFIKKALKKERNDKFLSSFVDSEYLALVLGEYMLKYDIPSEFMLKFPNYIPYIFLAYTTTQYVFLSHFESAFAKFSEFGILEVLLQAKMDQEYLKSCILKCPAKVSGLEDAILRYESFRERRFLSKMAPKISPEYADLIIDVHFLLSEYTFSLSPAQAYNLLKPAVERSCRVDFVEFLLKIL